VEYFKECLRALAALLMSRLIFLSLLVAVAVEALLLTPRREVVAVQVVIEPLMELLAQTLPLNRS
jgi:hypothetical protein